MEQFRNGITTTVCLWTFKRGGSRAGETINICWKIPSNESDRDPTRQMRLTTCCVNDVPFFYTRVQKALYFAHVVNKRFISSKAAAKAVYEYITGDNLPVDHSTDKRHCIVMADFCLASQDFDIIQDLRDLNGRPKSKTFDAFWAALQQMAEEHERVPDRRHGAVSYMPFAQSLRDLRSQVIRKLNVRVAAGELNAAVARAPSEAWIAYQFCAKHPSYASSLAYTGGSLQLYSECYCLLLMLIN
eukprot:scaffold282650_cov17-Prasinocladus_malaysianus.AAC.2